MTTVSATELALDATAAAAPEGAAGAPTRSFRPDIEGLRAVAVLAVLAFHASARSRGAATSASTCSSSSPAS